MFIYRASEIAIMRYNIVFVSFFSSSYSRTDRLSNRSLGHRSLIHLRVTRSIRSSKVSDPGYGRLSAYHVERIKIGLWQIFKHWQISVNYNRHQNWAGRRVEFKLPSLLRGWYIIEDAIEISRRVVEGSLTEVDHNPTPQNRGNEKASKACFIGTRGPFARFWLQFQMLYPSPFPHIFSIFLFFWPSSWTKTLEATSDQWPGPCDTCHIWLDHERLLSMSWYAVTQ